MAPLEGITVVSREQAVAAPFATRQLVESGVREIVWPISRYGNGAPYTSKNAYDLLAQCELGLPSIVSIRMAENVLHKARDW